MKQSVIWCMLFWCYLSFTMDPCKMSKNERINALVNAARSEDKKEIIKILNISKEKKSLDEDFMCVLCQLARCNDDKGICLLYQCGCNPCLKDERNEHVFSGISPFHLAALYGWDRALNVMLESSSTSESLDKYGDTALVIALSLGHSGAVKTLLAHGANPHVKDFLKRDPLLICKHGVQSLVEHKELLSKFLDVEQKRLEYEKCRQLIEEALLKK